MAKTFKAHVSFPLTIVVKTETVTGFLEAREEARKIPASGKVLKGESKFRIELMASDKSDDEVLQTIFRSAIREVLRKDFMSEIVGSKSTCRIGDTLVVFEDRNVSVGEVLAHCCCGNCARCNGYE
jgi:hypothetical protein